MKNLVFLLKVQVIFSIVLLFTVSSCSYDVHTQYTKCGTKQSKKKHAFYDSIQYK